MIKTKECNLVPDHHAVPRPDQYILPNTDTGIPTLSTSVCTDTLLEEGEDGRKKEDKEVEEEKKEALEEEEGKRRRWHTGKEMGGVWWVGRWIGGMGRRIDSTWFAEEEKRASDFLHEP